MILNRLKLLLVPKEHKPLTEWVRHVLTEQHYLRTLPHPTSNPLTYVVMYAANPVGCLVFGRSESTRCFTGRLTYGSVWDVQQGRATYSRWEILSLLRVWLSPDVQASGIYCTPDIVPGYVDRKGTWRSTVATSVIRAALGRVGFEYLAHYPPVWVDQPYQIRAVSSYCDTKKHRGTIYRMAGFDLAKTNGKRIETWYRLISPLVAHEDRIIRDRCYNSERSRAKRRTFALEVEQEEIPF